MGETWKFKREATFTGDFLPKLMPHYRQGDVDKACGFYCLAMILQYFEVSAAKDPQQWLRGTLSTLGSAIGFDRGLYQNELLRIVGMFPELDLFKRSPRPINFQSTRDFVEDIASKGIPGVLFYRIEGDNKGYNHYAVTVGAGVDKIFLMDPGINAHIGSLYNNWIQVDQDGILWDKFN